MVNVSTAVYCMPYCVHQLAVLKAFLIEENLQLFFNEQDQADIYAL